MSAFEKARKEASVFPLVTVSTTIRIIAAADARKEAPEFYHGSRKRGVTQGQFVFNGLNEDIPLFSPWFDTCTAVILRSPMVGQQDRQGIVHVWAGFQEHMHPYTREDLGDQITQGTEAIIVDLSSKLIPYSVIHTLKGLGVASTKYISVDTSPEQREKRFHVAYRPNTNEVLVKVGTDEEDCAVQVFEGFEHIEVPADEKETLKQFKQSFDKQRLRDILALQINDISEALHTGHPDEAYRIYMSTQRESAARDLTIGDVFSPDLQEALQRRIREGLQKMAQ
jgi:hypothetical protein